MKRLLPLPFLLAALALPLSAAPAQPGAVDFGTLLPPGSGGQFVEVNLQKHLIALAAKFVEQEEPEVAKLLNGLELVRVNVVEVSDKNRENVSERIQRIRKSLDGQGWERIVTVQEKDEQVGVYLRTREDKALAGLFVMVMEGDEAIFVNIVGDITPEQIGVIAKRFHLEPLKKVTEAIENG